MTSTYYKSFAPRIGIAYSPGRDGKTSIRAGWGLFYNPIEELVLAQFGAEPPFGGSSSLSDVFFNTPFVNQGEFTAPNPFGGIITPTKGQPTDLSLFRPILLYGEFEPHLRSQYTTQYNLTFQRDLSNSTMLQIGYVGSQGHRLLATHDINPSNPQTCLDIISIANAQSGEREFLPTSPATCGPTSEDAQWIVTVPTGFHVPHAQRHRRHTELTKRLNLVGLRPYSSPNCNSTLPALRPAPVAQSTAFPSSPTSSPKTPSPTPTTTRCEMMLQKRFSHGLQFQAAYTYSKSIDDGSTFEETLDPFNYRASRGLSLFNSKQRFVVSYDWELPVRKYSGFAGRLLDDWEVSGITQFQSGFPIRLNTEDDNELINSLFFLGTEAPSLVAPFQKLDPRKVLYLTWANHGRVLVQSQRFCTGNQSGAPFRRSAASTTARSALSAAVPDSSIGTSQCTRRSRLSETKYFQFRAEIFNVFNHTNYSNPDGGFSDGTRHSV